MSGIRMIPRKTEEHDREILHITREREDTYRAEIIDREGYVKQVIGNTTPENLEKAGYIQRHKSEYERAEELFPHITKESFKKGLKENFSRLSKKEQEEKEEKRREAAFRYLAKKMENMSLEDIYEKLGV